jgi:hypothetical protein
MPRRRYVLLAACTVATLVAGAGMGAQTRAAGPRAAGPLAPFGVGEAAVQSMLLRVLDGGGTLIEGAQIVSTIQKGYARVPVTMRAQATTAAFAWAKSYLHSPAFATAYAKFREQHRPRGAVIEAGSIDEIVQRRINEYVATLEEGKKGLDVLSPADRAKAIKFIADTIANARSPENVKGMRLAVELERDANAKSDQQATRDFDAKWPADPKAYVRKQLEYFMAMTANMDYTLPKIWIKDPSGATLGFLSPGLEDMPWETVRAFVIGKEAVDAARTAADAWLQELGK